MVKTRRELMLDEMGLTPLWRLREQEATGERAPGSSAPGASESQRASHGSQTEVHRSPVTRHASPHAAGDSRAATIMGLDWVQLKERVASCTDCALHEKRNKTVFGVGDENADWLFVGEGPGADEDAQGEPFVGQAGRLLDNMLTAINLNRGANVFIANVVKCRPPGNRNPAPQEAHACEPYLHRQIELIRPKLIIALGKVAVSNLLATDASIASLRGRIHQYRGIALIVTYHPAYLLRSLPDKAKAWADLCFAVRVMNDLQSAKGVSGE
jgi:uracil-DNA glycosylase